MAIYEQTWWKLALREYLLPFSWQYLWKKKCPGGCDFRGFTFLLVGVLCMSLLLLSTQQGLMNRFVETLLGNVPNSGVPIWVVPTLGHRFDAPLLQEIEKIAPVFPYRDIIPETKKISLPGHTQKPFLGRAVHFSDPFWKLADTTLPVPENCFPQTNGTLPLVVTLNKSWFVKNFDFIAYSEAMKNSKLPPPCLSTVANSIESFKVLWLKVNIRKSQFIPFKIRWVERIPAMEKIAFLFPMKTFHIMQVSKDLSALDYFPELQGGEGVRVKEIRVPKEYLGEAEFMACIKGRKLENVIQFSEYLPMYWIQACAKANNIPYTDNWNKEVRSGDRISHEKPWTLSLPYEPLNDIYKRMLTNEANELGIQDPYNNVPLDMLRKNFQITRALVYVQDYTKVSDSKNDILKLRVNGKQALYLHEIYKKSIDRFDFLTDSLKALRWPYGVIFGLFLLLLLWINIGTFIDHRQHRYGILLAKGMPQEQIRKMVYFQMFLVTSVGIIFALFLFFTAKFAINYLVFADVVEAHKDNLDIIGALYLLPFDWIYLLVWPVGVLVSIGIAALRLPLRHDTAASELLQ